MVVITVSGPCWKDLPATVTVTGRSSLEPWTYSCKGRRKVVREKGRKVESETMRAFIVLSFLALLAVLRFGRA